MINSKFDVNNANTLVMQMKAEVEKYTKLLELAEQDRIKTVQHNVSYFNLTYAIPKALKWQGMKNNNLDKRKKYEEKGFWDYLEHAVRELLDDNNIVMSEIITFGYNDLIWEIRFNSDGIYYELDVPNIEAMNVKKWIYSDGTIRLLYEESESCWNFIHTTYDEHELKSAYHEFKEKGKKVINTF